MKNIFTITLLLFSFTALADIKIAFLKVYNYNGDLLRLEKNGQFAHVALSYKDGWIHAHPKKGVEYVKTLSHIGFRKYETVILYSLKNKYSETLAQKYLGKPYDKEYRWSDVEIYCSELVAKLLKIKPSAMTFDPEIWGDNHPGRGSLGISPDEIYYEALKRKYKRIGKK